MKPAASGGTDFCYGDYEALKITGFTEPAEHEGVRVSTVNYSYSVADISDWAKSDFLLKNFPQVSKDLKSDVEPLSGKATFILTNNAWVHEELFER